MYTQFNWLIEARFVVYLSFLLVLVHNAARPVRVSHPHITARDGSARPVTRD
jgi:hypothetical protein